MAKTQEQEGQLPVPEKTFTVSEYVELWNNFFKKIKPAKVLGEISQVKSGPSGHIYFTVKDKSGTSILDCIIWNRNYLMCGVKFEVGMEVILQGRPSIYGPSGRFSFIADTVELVGEGALKKAYDELKKKLEKAGVFAEERKRSLPEFVHRIGVITSRDGAVIHDFVNNLGKFGFEILLVDSRVEGQQATKSLLDSVKTLRDKKIEVLVIIRGGGSLESLQAFNNEALIREIVDFPVPVIAGIGHDQDVPLLALAADYMTSTPTAAAHLLNQSWEEAYSKIRAFANILNRIPAEIRRIREDINRTWLITTEFLESRIKDIRQTLAMTEQMIKLNDPTRQLKLGYSIARLGGKIVRDTSGLKKGDVLEIQLGKGEIETEVKNIKK
ncbi:MAG TPA: exodeoxyribonuclease VII large subunit [Candidatus Paceibacterota bacterium]